MKLTRFLCFVLLFGWMAAHAGEPSAARAIRGKVSDKSTKESLAGIKVLIEGTSYYTYTDFEGNYTLLIPQNIKAVLNVSGISYQDEKITLDPALSQVNVELKEL